MDPNRKNAVKILHQVLRKGEKIKDAMTKGLPSGLSDRDRAFIMELVYGCTRHRLYLEWILAQFVQRTKNLPPKTFINIMTGIYQLSIMETSEWAAVNETVEVEKGLKGTPSLVNGVLRNYLRSRDSLQVPSLSDDEIAHISITTSHPAWLVKRWRSRFSLDETIAFSEANNTIPPLCIRINTLTSSLEKVTAILKDLDVSYTASIYSPCGLTIENIPFSRLLPLKGKIFIQDEASQIISYLLAPLPEQRILDTCAAPGGKTTHLAQITENKATIIGVDSSRKRLALLKENAAVLQARSIVSVQKDILSYMDQDGFDRVLVDAPCSALGIIRRSPDVKYRHTPASLAEFGKRQVRILEHASSLLRPGGTLVYSVCSTEPEETSAVVQDFLNNKKDFYIIDNVLDIDLPEPFRKKISGLFDTRGYMFTYPHIHGTDGFFAVRLGKK